MTWLSPAFPVGGFAYSQGLETAFATDRIADVQALEDWLRVQLMQGSIWNDAIYCAESWRVAKDAEALQALADHCEAFANGAERRDESVAQGDAFLTAAGAWASDGDATLSSAPMPVAVGAVAGRRNIPLQPTLSAYLHTLVSASVQAALRLGRLGQQDGVRLLAALEADILKTAKRAAGSSLEDLGGCTFIADIMSLQHETLPSRIFRS
ncbi:MAG: urease accessory protein UreF [Pseudomonadota bacterium]